MQELFVEAKIENADAVVEFITQHLGDCPPKTQHQIEIAAEEIFTNIANYAYNPETGNVAVRVAAVDDAITIEFEDSGTEYDPVSQEAPDLSPKGGKRKAGGLGIFMVKNFMDSVQYRREGNLNILMIKKSLMP